MPIGTKIKRGLVGVFVPPSKREGYIRDIEHEEKVYSTHKSSRQAGELVQAERTGREEARIEADARLRKSRQSAKSGGGLGGSLMGALGTYESIAGGWTKNQNRVWGMPSGPAPRPSKHRSTKYVVVGGKAVPLAKRSRKRRNDPYDPFRDFAPV